MATNLGYYNIWTLQPVSSSGNFTDIGDVKEISEFALTSIKAPLGRNKNKTTKKDFLLTLVVSDVASGILTALEQAEGHGISALRGSVLSGSSVVEVGPAALNFDRVLSKTAEEVDTFVVSLSGQAYRELDVLRFD